MRVTLINQGGTTATLQCIVSGTSIRAHLDRVRFIKKPLTYGLMKDWERTLRMEIGYFQSGFTYHPDQCPGPLSSRVGRIVGENALYQAPTLGRHLLDNDLDQPVITDQTLDDSPVSQSLVPIITTPEPLAVFPKSALATRQHKGVVVKRYVTIREPEEE